MSCKKVHIVKYSIFETQQNQTDAMLLPPKKEKASLSKEALVYLISFIIMLIVLAVFFFTLRK